MALLFAEPRKSSHCWGLSVPVLPTIPTSMLQILLKLLRNNYGSLCILTAFVGLSKYNKQERKNPNFNSLTFTNTNSLSMFALSLVCVTMGFYLWLALCYIPFNFKVIDIHAFFLFLRDVFARLMNTHKIIAVKCQYIYFSSWWQCE